MIFVCLVGICVVFLDSHTVRCRPSTLTDQGTGNVVERLRQEGQGHLLLERVGHLLPVVVDDRNLGLLHRNIEFPQ